MPRLSYFYGITIKMYWREDHHSTPHFHAYYGEHEASLDLAGEIIAGFLPKRALRLVQDWAELPRRRVEGRLGACHQQRTYGADRAAALE